MSDAFQLKNIKGGIDRRGLCVLTYEFAAIGVTEGQALLMSLPIQTSMKQVERRIAEFISNFNFTISATFEGIIVGWAASSDQEQFHVQPEWREEPIETFPRLQDLIDQYGAYFDDNNKLQFPRTMPSTSGTGSGSGLGQSSSSADINPYYGVTTYPVQRFVASHSYIAENVPPSVYSKAGNVVKSIPLGFGAIPGAQSWIIDNPSTRKRGNGWEITERYKSCDMLQYLGALYNLLQK